MSRLVCAAWRAMWCEIRGHDYCTLYAYPDRLKAGRGPTTVRMLQCLRCGRFGGYSRTDDPS